MTTAMMRHVGMGALGSWTDLAPPIDLGGDDWDAYLRQQSTPTYGTSPTFPQPGQYSPFKIALPSLIAQGLKVIDDIAAPTVATQARYGAAGLQRLQSSGVQSSVYNPQGQLVGYTDASGRFYPSQGSVQPGVSASTSGLNLFGSQIGWGTIALVGGLIFLIQMPGFSRRGR